MLHVPLLALAVLPIPQSEAVPPAAAPVVAVPAALETFDADPGIAATATGDGARRSGVGPKVAGGELIVLEPWWKLDTSVGLPAAEGAAASRELAVAFDLQLEVGCEGAGFAWLALEEFGDAGAPPLPGPSPECRVEVEHEDGTTTVHGGWEAPNFAGSLGIGFDARNPWTNEPFRGSGNIHHRPEHEISLHWDGRERFKKTTGIDFRDGEEHAVALNVEYVPGGAFVDLTLDDEVVFERYFLPGATAYAGRAAFGGRNAATAGWAAVDDLRVAQQGAAEVPFPEPTVITAIDAQLNHSGAHETRGTATLPDDLSGYERILLTLKLDEPENGFDPWDRLAHLYVEDPELGRVELLRYITPYDLGGEWTLDVTDMAPVLTGERSFVQRCETYAQGWVVSVELSLYPRPEGWAAGPQPYRIERLWEGKCIVGNPDNPTSDFFPLRTLALDPETVAVEVRTAVTGHGMSPNTDNAAEFMPLDRVLIVGGAAFEDTLWKTDNYLNPVRPQGGTWKYDRAGWAPGDIVPPWEVLAPAAVLGGETLDVHYEIAPYENVNRGQTWEPFHQVASYAVLFRDAGAD